MFSLRFAIAMLGATLYAQPQQTENAPLRFAAASVKPNTSMRNGMGNKFDPTMARWTNMPLRNLIESAYGLQDYQAAGWPDWLRAAKWDIDAKTEGATTYLQKRQMLQTLLVERFGLKFHREMKDLQGYSLVIAKGGPRLHEVKEGEVGSAQAGTRIDRGLISGHHVHMMDWVGFLIGELGCPVEDNTGLKGVYDFKLEWSPDESQPNSGGEPGDPNGPTIFAAMQDQLGLKLEVKKFPIEMFVIDHIDRVPTAN